MEHENYHSQKVGIKEISLEQYRRCATEGSKNLVNDSLQREIYFNAVQLMEIILLPDTDRKGYEELKQQLKDNTEKINELKQKFKRHLKELQGQAGDARQINTPLLSNHYERELIEIYHEKLILLGQILKKMNYYEERAVRI